MNWKPQYVRVDYDENYNLVVENVADQPTNWKFRSIYDVIHAQFGFSSWRDARRAWGTEWKLIRNSFCGRYALENADRVVSVRDPHKPSDTIKKLLEESRLKANSVLVLEREGYADMYIHKGGVLSFYKNKLQMVDGELVPTELLSDLWTDINFAGIAEEGGVQLKNSKKPEKLLRRIISMATEPGDWVLDCFLGSGTTSAVAHKMGRRWIGIEAGEHAKTLCFPRLKRVVDGIDQSGISRLVPPHPTRVTTKEYLFGLQPAQLGWSGGDGFCFYTLGKALLDKDNELGVSRLNYDNGQLIEAVCLQEGFKLYDNGIRHGVKGRRYAHVTEQFVTQEYVDMMARELDESESLTVYCLKMAGDLEMPDTVEIKRIPQALLKETTT